MLTSLSTVDDGSTEMSMNYRLLSWGFSPRPVSARSTPDGPRPNVAIFEGPPRVLEVVSSSPSFLVLCLFPFFYV